jgi:ABC-type Fe3+/spermidine/putrescine transport system ATPase subunit
MILIDELLSQLDPSLRKRLSIGTDVEVKKQKTPSTGLTKALEVALHMVDKF